MLTAAYIGLHFEQKSTSLKMNLAKQKGETK